MGTGLSIYILFVFNSNNQLNIYYIFIYIKKALNVTTIGSMKSHHNNSYYYYVINYF